MAEISVKEAEGFKYQFSKGSNVSPCWEVRNGAILMTETRKTIHLPHGKDSGTWESFARGIWIPGKFCMWKPES